MAAASVKSAAITMAMRMSGQSSKSAQKRGKYYVQHKVSGSYHFCGKDYVQHNASDSYSSHGKDRTFVVVRGSVRVKVKLRLKVLIIHRAERH